MCCAAAGAALKNAAVAFEDDFVSLCLLAPPLFYRATLPVRSRCPPRPSAIPGGGVHGEVEEFAEPKSTDAGEALAVFFQAEATKGQKERIKRK